MRFEGACSVLRSCVGALIVAKYLAEQKPGGLGKEIGEDELEEDVSSSNSSSAGGSKPLPPLKEPVTGIFIPATLEVEGGAGPLVSVGCGPRIKKLGFIEVKVYALGVFVEASATSQAALEPLQGADVFKALLSQVCFDLGGWSNFDVVSRFRPQSPRRSCIACLCPPPPPLTCAFRGASRRGGRGCVLRGWQDPATFFRRALHLVFARSVTGKQVADALAEKLKAALSPEAFNAFSQALLAGTRTAPPPAAAAPMPRSRPSAWPLTLQHRRAALAPCRLWSMQASCVAVFICFRPFGSVDSWACLLLACFSFSFLLSCCAALL